MEQFVLPAAKDASNAVRVQLAESVCLSSGSLLLLAVPSVLQRCWDVIDALI